MGAPVPSASRAPIGVAAANRKQNLHLVIWGFSTEELTREFYGFRENRDFLELIPLCSTEGGQIEKVFTYQKKSPSSPTGSGEADKAVLG